MCEVIVYCEFGRTDVCVCLYVLLFWQLREFSSSSSASSDEEDLEKIEETIQQEVDHQGLADSLAEPEFSGLWDQNFKVH